MFLEQRQTNYSGYFYENGSEEYRLFFDRFNLNRSKIRPRKKMDVKEICEIEDVQSFITTNQAGFPQVYNTKFI